MLSVDCPFRGSLRVRPIRINCAEVVAAREERRAKTGYGDLSVEAFDKVLRKDTLRVGLWLDSSELTVSETVAHILANLHQAHITKVP